MTINTDTWRKAEQNMIRRERVARIHNGTIIPAFCGLTVPMAKDSSGKWWPNENFTREMFK